MNSPSTQRRNPAQSSPGRWKGLSRGVVGGILALLILLGIGLAQAAAAQPRSPALVLSMSQGAAGAGLKIQGQGFSPGGYSATLFWDTLAVESFFIPNGGNFVRQMIIPPNAAPGKYEIRVCAGNPCFTGEFAQQASASFEVTAPMPLFTGTVAYLHADDDIVSDAPLRAESYQEMLQSYELRVEPIPVSQLAQHDLTAYDLLIIGPMTHLTQVWAAPERVAQVMEAGRPVLGLGDGGHTLFDQWELAIGSPSAFRGYLQEVAVQDPSLTALQAPHDLMDLAGQNLFIFSNTEGMVTLPATSQTAETLALADLVNFGQATKDAVLIQEGCFTLWGGDQYPEALTRVGRALLVNAIHIAMRTPCAAERIRICEELRGNLCKPLADAPVHLIRNGFYTGQILYSDEEGYLTERSAVMEGDELWPKVHEETRNRYHRYRTTQVPALVKPDAFLPDGTMHIVADYPLILWDLIFSTQWDLTTNTFYMGRLAQRIIDGSNHFYDFTDGQMALGQVTVYQNYDRWDEADVRVYASNTLHPNAVIGGIIPAPVADPLVPDLVYYPGRVHMGREWNRTGAPPLPDSLRMADPLRATAQSEDDWAIAFAHELGHYLLFLFDTYIGLNEEGELVRIDTCTGSAMGYVYDPANHEFVADPVHWAENCGDTLANQTLQRTEWETIRLWYQRLLAPAQPFPGPAATYIPITQVNFIPPSQSGGDPLPSSLFTLGYQNGETASGVAQGYLLREGRVLAQGQPVSGTTQLELNDPQVGDRFCLFDVSNLEGASRHQFGCKILEAGDGELPLKKDTTWEPYVAVSPITSQTIAISVTQALSDGMALRATLYPEDANTPTEIKLETDGDLHTGVFLSPVPAASAYVAVFVEEEATPVDPRREVMTDYGVGGSGAEGPTSIWGFAPIVSGDGRAGYTPPNTRELAAGEFIAWQATVGRPEALPGSRFEGDVYRLLAQPPSLVAEGFISIRVGQGVAPVRSQSQTPGAIHFWREGQWQRLPSRVLVDEEGGRQLVAFSQGPGTYAIFTPRSDSLNIHLFLPQIAR